MNLTILIQIQIIITNKTKLFQTEIEKIFHNQLPNRQKMKSIQTKEDRRGPDTVTYHDHLEELHHKIQI